MTAIPIGSTCLIVSGYNVAPHLIGCEVVIYASYTKGNAPTAWYKGRTRDGTLVTGPPMAFLRIDPLPIITNKE